MQKAWFFLGSLVFVGIIAACGNADLGESCDDEGKVSGQCTDSLVCGRKEDTGGDLVCLKQCSSQADCSANEACLGVGNSSLKGCRIKHQ
jgi:hypothetical protein